MTEKDVEQSFRLVEIATRWFVRAWEAHERGDLAGATVARLAHAMTAAAHKELARGG